MPYDPEHHGPHRVVGPGFHARVFELVETVPAGRVTTYGDIATALGLKTAARHVGFALAALTREDVPWHRVVNGKGVPPQGDRQRRLLEAEGLSFRDNGRIDRFATLRFRF